MLEQAVLEPKEEELITPIPVEPKLGSGGLGDVFVCSYIDPGEYHKKPVAVKVPNSKMKEDIEFMERVFTAETRGQKRASGKEGVLPLIDYNSKSIFQLVTPVMDTTMLKKIKKDGPLNVKEFVDYAIEISQGLKNIHDSGVLHRDIKPDNVYLKDGKAQIGDFGLVAISGENDLVCRDRGCGVGSPHYMSPDQGRGEEGNFTMDIYSLGITFFVMATAMRPFSGKSPLDIMMSHVRNAMPSASKINSNIPKDLDEYIFKMCEKSPDKRPQSAHEVLEWFQAYKDNGYKAPEEPGVVMRTIKNMRNGLLKIIGRGKTDTVEEAKPYEAPVFEYVQDSDYEIPGTQEIPAVPRRVHLDDDSKAKYESQVPPQATDSMFARELDQVVRGNVKDDDPVYSPTIEEVGPLGSTDITHEVLPGDLESLSSGWDFMDTNVPIIVPQYTESTSSEESNNFDFMDTNFPSAKSARTMKKTPQYTMPTSSEESNRFDFMDTKV